MAGKVLVALAALAAVAAAASPLAEIAAMTAERRATGVWAVLVAGSNGYSNYRHQSDVCAMYQQLHAMGVPDEKIIVLMYDDIANSASNPRKGVIINTPGGPDVYKGVPKDYTGRTVTPKNFVTILEGGAPAGGSGKKLQSTSSDHVFVFFSDHGGIDILAFPSGELTSKMLHDAVTTMASKKLFGKLVINVEACEAGSMFYKYTWPQNVFITTASPISESSYAWQYDDTVQAYLSDVWSWYMLDYMKSEENMETTLQEQFKAVEKAMSNWSQPCEYGDMASGAQTLGEFYLAGKEPQQQQRARLELPRDAVRAWDAPLEALRRQHAKQGTKETLEALRREQDVHDRVDAIASRVARRLRLSQNAVAQPAACTKALAVGDCASELAAALRESCGTAHDYLDSLSPLVWAACGSGVNAASARKVIEAECAAL